MRFARCCHGAIMSSRRPARAVRLQSGEDVLIVRGTAQDLGTPAQVPDVATAP